MIKTVHFHHETSRAMGGTYSTLKKFLAVFTPPHFESHIISFDSHPITENSDIEPDRIFRLMTRQNAVSRYYRQVGSHAIDQARKICSEADLIFVHLLYRHHCIVAAQLAKELNKPLVIVPHGALDPYCFTYRGAIKRAWLSYYGDLLIRPSNFVFATEQEAIKAQSVVGRVRSHVVSWPCKLADSVRSDQWNTSPTVGPPKLLFVGRLHPVKRVIETVTAMHTLPGSACTLRLVGEPSGEVTREIIEASAGRLLGCTVFYDGAAYGDDLLEKYMDCDGLVLFSHKENFGNVVAEAMACGKPVFVSEDVDIAPLIEKNRCGLVFRIRHEDDISAALGTISRLSRAELANMGRNGRAVAEAEFSFGRFSERLRSFAHSVYDAHPALEFLGRSAPSIESPST